MFLAYPSAAGLRQPPARLSDCHLLMARRTGITRLNRYTRAQASNVVIDMSQVEDYTQYQTDLQQCEGLAVQNQPDAPQRESVAGTAVKGAAVGAAAGAVGGKSGSKAAKELSLIHI